MQGAPARQRGRGPVRRLSGAVSRGAGLLAGVLLALAPGGCGGGAPAPPPVPQARDDVRVLVIGIDGAAWDEALPLMARGELPNLERLARDGYSAHLTTDAPALSPVVWTTIATGKQKEKHGIRGFVVRDPRGKRIPVTSNLRRTSAIWNMLGEAGVEVGVVGWWVTWPAEPVNGWMVSPYASPGQKTWKGTLHADGREGQTWPPEYFSEMAPIVEGAVESGRDSFGRLVQVPEAMVLPAYLQAFLADTEWVHVADTTFRDVAADLIRSKAPRFAAVYFAGVDVVGHRFWRFSHPGEGDWESTPEQQEVFGPALANTYRWTDAAIGRILDALPEGTTVLVVSDHGMEVVPPELRKDKEPRPENLFPGETSGGHQKGPSGLFILSGPLAGRNFDPGFWDGGRGLPTLGSPAHKGIFDVTPTLLHLFGLPVGLNMEGTVLTQVLTPEVAARAIGTVEWDTLLAWGSEGTEIDEDRREEQIRRLESLGYISPE